MVASQLCDLDALPTWLDEGSTEGGELHAEQSLVLAHVEELLLIPHWTTVKECRMVLPKGFTGDDHERVHVPRIESHFQYD